MFCFSVSLRPQKPSGLLGTGNPGWPPRLPYSSWTLRARVQCCFTTTETIRRVRDGEPRTATSTFTQLLSCDPTCEGDRSLHVASKRLTNPTSAGLFQSCCRWALVNMQITTLSTDSYGIQKYVHPSLIIWMRIRTSRLPAHKSSQD